MEALLDQDSRQTQEERGMKNRSTPTTQSAENLDVFPLQRISRSQLALSTLLVPYPRVGKRSTNGTDHQVSAPILHAKRLFATVGKRTYMYAARVGK
ncbi:hypothetical protein NECAME_16167 [Necator americanus]|uniref:Uncharacterized protein n=1 Tax=Necator americanus TaxID=51031 RepID=W2U0A3_NECAM|nr:hypothetical protein NECAME_16167 [Necator americanus]ETN86732.1 hypothetical protein NECAME_16167 [Necator americanus]